MNNPNIIPAWGEGGKYTAGKTWECWGRHGINYKRASHMHTYTHTWASKQTLQTSFQQEVKEAKYTAGKTWECWGRHGINYKRASHMHTYTHTWASKQMNNPNIIPAGGERDKYTAGKTWECWGRHGINTKRLHTYIHTYIHSYMHTFIHEQGNKRTIPKSFQQEVKETRTQ